MKSKSILYLVKKNLLSRKISCIMIVLLLVITILTIVTTQTFSLSYSNTMNKKINNNYLSRTYNVTLERDNITDVPTTIKDILLLPNVVSAFENRGRVFLGACEELKTDVVSGELALYGADEYMLPEVTFGTGFKRDSKKVGIVPEKIYPATDLELDGAFTNKGYVDGKEYIGKKLTTTAKTSSGKAVSYTFKVVGVFNSEESVNENNECFIPYNDVLKLNDQVYYGRPDDDYPQIMVVVDEYENMNSVLSSLKKRQYYPFLVSNINVSRGVFIGIIGYALSFVIMLTAFIVATLLSVKAIDSKRYEIGLLKSFGYKDRAIYTILLSEVLVLGLISFILGCVISIATVCVAQAIFDAGGTYWNGLVLHMSWVSFAICFVVSILLPFISSLFVLNKIGKISPKIVLSEG